MPWQDHQQFATSIKVENALQIFVADSLRGGLDLPRTTFSKTKNMTLRYPFAGSVFLISNAKKHTIATIRMRKSFKHTLFPHDDEYDDQDGDGYADHHPKSPIFVVERHACVHTPKRRDHGGHVDADGYDGERFHDDVEVVGYERRIRVHRAGKNVAVYI